METITDKAIREMVARNVIKVLKDHNIYYIFRCFINVVGEASERNIYLQIPLKTMKKCRDKSKYYSGDNPFSIACSLNDVIDTLEKINGGYSKPFSLKNPKMIQEIVLKHVNHLLHYCVERGVKDMTIMETLGRESFEMCCKQIFGDDFVDEMMPETAPMSEEFKKKLSGNPFLNELFSMNLPDEVRNWVIQSRQRTTMDNDDDASPFGFYLPDARLEDDINYPY